MRHTKIWKIWILRVTTAVRATLFIAWIDKFEKYFKKHKKIYRNSKSIKTNIFCRPYKNSSKQYSTNPFRKQLARKCSPRTTAIQRLWTARSNRSSRSTNRSNRSTASDWLTAAVPLPHRPRSQQRVPFVLIVERAVLFSKFQFCGQVVCGTLNRN